MFSVNAVKPLQHGASKIYLQLTSTFLCSKLVARNCLRSDASAMTVHFSALAGRGTDFPSWRDEVAGVLSDLAYPPFRPKMFATWLDCLLITLFLSA